eukprot:CAMPEP_0118686654 /NCGR_PEP_ID=MMETSP0800-20121206/7936_1 /TAXON_ID=210618 ORGANISM="Striatella unipunctata, Strain CCMP2910" /NCGR_SAMPLE_ID=MMETSP0800 /ASSEMBLY_ACC=CAM_ASM_000638 /LENGTH=571 /DNA_ID=CAMNT_0006583729 /DNA_START=12 /DNA_END=1727 /DNA_ORIENTATION=-
MNTQGEKGGGPSALIIGTSFIKQYYQVLSYTPDQIHKFYKPNSMISHSLEVGAPTTPTTLQDQSGKLFDWVATAPEENDVIRIDLEGGAIDAQESIHGSVLLVVAGNMTLPRQTKARSFVHTFILAINESAPGQKKQFYVHNDVLRFLTDESLETATQQEHQEDPAADKTPAPEQTAERKVEEETILSEETGEKIIETEKEKTQETAEKTTEEAPEPIQVANSGVDNVEEEKVENVDPAPVVEPETTQVISEEVVQVKEEPPVASKAVEETKEDPVIVTEEEEKVEESETNVITPQVEEITPVPNQRNEHRRKDRSRSRRSGRNQQQHNHQRKTNGEANEEDTKSKPKTPDSWASLVASGNNTSNTVIIKPPPAPQQQQEPPVKEKDSKETERPSGGGKEQNQGSGGGNRNSNRNHEKGRGGRSGNNSSGSAGSSPECTLYVRNVPDATKEPEFRQLFESFASKVNTKVLGITLNAHRGYAFVDFNSTEAVEAALVDSFSIQGRTLEVERKTRSRPQQQNQQGGRSGFRVNQAQGNNSNGSKGRQGGNGRRGNSRGGSGGGGGGNRSGSTR